ncbi:hypothetical protein M885DRAFT_616746 [Pelagophyceae sp. CCMP2097]|nr:hypothetical protein M885DRAFT_616746 [Pelagophyceae sp. CCMP2097]|mmetsp:Transcript_7824/g.25520  ORF Transcript_7824/g.25520 Transcript_7824/m.25520 type:complete len:197 (-) Transcript_7824:35-625(-)|eukprot:CAMPEP_0206808644 /NCGR_PEP_ID=MMETSP0975-20121206/5846_1 /ASSEMBLY_ACC=CAM_ASM_000399 /TAXON_ID=483370 /ORGANISM="non described non described, Strain CCMP2097" /LENGTH=196 /DNA_ID=CAMNT_0054350737 /DNA_START=30 /DNA_END=620 /DNA_ORIENTATION=+
MGKRVREEKPEPVVATFDEKERREWLTGFSKRKTERRRKGLAYQALKDRKAKLEARAERRSQKTALPTVPEPVKLNEVAQPLPTVRYEDSDVMELWGNAVTVTTTLGLEIDSEDERAAAPTPKSRIDEEQLRAGTLETMKKKVSLTMGRSARQERRSALKRDRTAASKVRGTGGKLGKIAEKLVTKKGGPAKGKKK